MTPLDNRSSMNALSPSPPSSSPSHPLPSTTSAAWLQNASSSSHDSLVTGCWLPWQPPTSLEVSSESCRAGVWWALIRICSDSTCVHKGCSEERGGGRGVGESWRVWRSLDARPRSLWMSAECGESISLLLHTHTHACTHTESVTDIIIIIWYTYTLYMRSFYGCMSLHTHTTD